jgi:hypothetical protein
MPVLGLHCSHKQVHPSTLLAACQRAEAAGFGAAMSSDPFSPWSARQGHSAFAWSWLGAALRATSMPFGQEQEAFVDAFGAKVLPQLRSIKKGSAA